MQLRPYQTKQKEGIYNAWRFAPCPLAVTPTGGGKTVLFSSILEEHSGPRVAIAHRQELVSQISLALARYGVRHRIIGPKSVVKFINQLHVMKLGASYYDAGSPCAVAGVDTLLSRKDDLKPWLDKVGLWVMDEAHHVLRANKWGKAVALMPNAKGLGVTANTIRADGKGIGRHADGYFDTIIEGPGMRDLINDGFLTPYRIFAPPSDLNLDAVPISERTGDYNQTQLRVEVRRSHIVGDVVDHYLRLARGKLGITFATDVETATDIALKFKAAGVPSEVVSAKTPDPVRVEILRRFERRDVLNLVNVDLFGEGFDLPAIEVVSMARPTESFNLFCQQFGRGLRPFYAGGYDLTTHDGRLQAIARSIKPQAIIIDHVNNCVRFSTTHGLPDSKIAWSLDRRERRTRTEKDPDLIPTVSCPGCTALIERIHKVCPYCGHVRIPAARSAPEFVDGDLYELDEATLALMRGEVAKIDKDPARVREELTRSGLPYPAAKGAENRHRERQEAQQVLREAIAMWAGYQRAQGRKDPESHRRFYFMFGKDVLTAQSLGRPEALELAARINNSMGV